MARTPRYPALDLGVHGEHVVRLDPDENQALVVKRARRLVDDQLIRAARNATSGKARRELERRVIDVEPKGRRSIVLRRRQNATRPVRQQPETA